MSKKTALATDITENKNEGSDKSLHGLSPEYIRAMVELHTPERTGLRSEIFLHLKVPNLKRKTFAARSYIVVTPIWWNKLQNTIKQADNIDIFKTKLKTYFFNTYFNAIAQL